MFPTHGKFADASDVAESDLTTGMKRVRKLAIDLGRELLGVEVLVSFLKSPKANTRADYSKFPGWETGEMRFNISRLGEEWFNIKGDKLGPVVDLIIHELAHHVESSHKAERYYRALTSLAGKVTVLALRDPSLFKA